MIGAIEQMLASYDENPRHQFSVQEMIEHVTAAGVIMTLDLADGAPYYVLNYDDQSGRTDVVTSGRGINKTVYLHRNTVEEDLDSWRVRQMVRLARELEIVCGDIPIDIEFVLDSDQKMHLLQVRQISTSRSWHPEVEERVNWRPPHIAKFIGEASRRKPGLFGDRTIFANMPD